jgi:hypothetical protein
MRAMWLVCGLLVACAGDTKDSSTETALPPAPTGGTDTDSETDTSPPPACPYEGTWTLQSITCDGVDATASYTAAVESTTLVATASPSGGCYVEIFLASTYCTEAEEIDASALSNDVWTVLGFGISSCKPAACTFDALDAPCAVGHAGGRQGHVLRCRGSLGAGDHARAMRTTAPTSARRTPRSDRPCGPSACRSTDT